MHYCYIISKKFRKIMIKLILLTSLVFINVHANKNWIKISSNNNSGFKMYKPTSSYNKTKRSRYNKSNKNQGIKLIDVKLINSIRLVKSQAKRYK